MREHQNWQGTNVAPAIPMAARRAVKPAAELTKPMHDVGKEATQSKRPIRIRGPNLSHKGPMRKRIKMVEPTPIMLAVHTSFLVIPMSSRISPRKGAMANQMKKAMKKPHHEQ